MNIKCPSCKYEKDTHIYDYKNPEFSRLDFKVKIRIGDNIQEFDVDIYNYENYQHTSVDLYVCPKCATVIQY